MTDEEAKQAKRVSERDAATPTTTQTQTASETTETTPLSVLLVVVRGTRVCVCVCACGGWRVCGWGARVIDLVRGRVEPKGWRIRVVVHVAVHIDGHAIMLVVPGCAPKLGRG